jgi:transposase InsO family protein
LAKRSQFFAVALGQQFVAKAVQDWIAAVGAKTAYIAPASPWENGYIESFHARLRDELLDGEIFLHAEGTDHRRKLVPSLQQGQSHASLGYRPPAPEVFVPAFAAWPAAQPRPAPLATLQLAQRPTLN